MDPDLLSDALDAFADAKLARKLSRDIRTIRGVRGVPHGEIARLAAAAWLEERPRLPNDEDALDTLFGSAHEDGLLAIGLLAAALPDRPEVALDIGRGWLDRIDDLHTADALGWLVLGPGLLATGDDLGRFLGPLRGHGHPAVHRAGVMMGMAMTPTPIEGPAAAPLRARLKTKIVRFVDQPLSDRLTVVADVFLRDPSPPVQKGLRRVLGAWARFAPDEATAWMAEVRGGVPAMLRTEVEKSARRGRRRRGP